MIRTVVADDQELVRDAFALILTAQDDIDVVGTAADGRAAVRLVQQTKPDVALLDIRMPIMDGIQATRAIVAAHPSSRVLILTTYDIDTYVLDALRAGASGFLLKDSPRASMRPQSGPSPRARSYSTPTSPADSSPTTSTADATPRPPISYAGSPPGNARSSTRSPKAAPTPRSPPPCSSPKPP